MRIIKALLHYTKTIAKTSTLLLGMLYTTHIQAFPPPPNIVLPQPERTATPVSQPQSLEYRVLRVKKSIHCAVTKLESATDKTEAARLSRRIKRQTERMEKLTGTQEDSAQ